MKQMRHKPVVQKLRSETELLHTGRSDRLTLRGECEGCPVFCTEFRLIHWVWVVILLSVSACKKTDSAIQDNRRIHVIGHGGSGFTDQSWYPPNSWTSAVEAVDRQGADGVEIDLQMSRDSVLFMYHDQHLDAASFCSGCVHGWAAGVLQDCVFKPRSGSRAEERITRVERLLGKYASAEKKPVVFLDLKNPLDCLVDSTDEWIKYYQAFLYQVNRLISKYDAAEWVMLQSDKKEWLVYARSQYPEIRVLLDYIKDTSDILYAARNDFYGVAAPDQDLSAADVALAHNHGLKVQLYGARLQEEMAEALNKRPDYFLTDNIPLTQRILAAGP